MVYKWYVFGATVLAPLSLPLAVGWLRLPKSVAFTASVPAIFVWLSALRRCHTAGMVSFVLASYLALPFAALNSVLTGHYR